MTRRKKTGLAVKLAATAALGSLALTGAADAQLKAIKTATNITPSERKQGDEAHPQLMADLMLFLTGPGFGVQVGAGVELPTQDDDRPLRLLQGGRVGVEIGLIFHQNREAAGGRAPPHPGTGAQQTSFIAVSDLGHSACLPDSRDTAMGPLPSPFHGASARSIFGGRIVTFAKKAHKCAAERAGRSFQCRCWSN